MKKEIRIFFTALMYFTRIPCPKWVDHSEEYLNKSSRYFPIVGIIVGAISALSFWIFQWILPAISIIVSMVTSILTTGAFHEDGFADVCDGFGGGWTKEKILLIMKDSRLGAFGVLGLILILLLKWSLLIHLPSVNLVIITLISGHAISRLNAVSLIYTDEYARDDDSSKSKPLATKMGTGSLVFAIITGFAPLFLFGNWYIFLTLVPLLLTRWYFSRYFKKWIGGYTGDCLGALQQVSEIVFYISLQAIFRYIKYQP